MLYGAVSDPVDRETVWCRKGRGTFRSDYLSTNARHRWKNCPQEYSTSIRIRGRSEQWATLVALTTGVCVRPLQIPHMFSMRSGQLQLRSEHVLEDWRFHALLVHRRLRTGKVISMKGHVLRIVVDVKWDLWAHMCVFLQSPSAAATQVLPGAGSWVIN